MLFLYLEPGAATEAGLSEILGVPRSTVRGHVNEAVALGMMERTEDGVRQTPGAREVVERFSQEAIAIAKGERRGFSETMAAQILSIQESSINPKKQKTTFDELISLNF